MLTPQKVFLAAVGVFLILYGDPSKLWERKWHEEHFKAYMKRYNKTYPNETLYERRFAAFKKSLQAIEWLNDNRTHNTSALYGLTLYSDMFEEEFASEKLLLRGKTINEEVIEEKTKKKRQISLDLPRKIDWRSKGVITDVNNQESCGACWAFSTIETIESMHAIKTGELLKLSTQQMIDCAGYNNNGCLGGDICTLLDWLTDQDITIRLESDYPLHLVREQCKTFPDSNQTNTKSVKVLDFDCQQVIGDENYLLEMIAKHGPLTVAINAIKWQNYLGGVIQYHCSPHFLLMNHAVQIVGYDLDAEIPHYIVRNSWGTDFGDKGYLYIAIGDNLCGLANEVSVITVS